MGVLSPHNTAQAKRKKISAGSWRKTTTHGPRRTSLRSDELRLGRQLMAETDSSWERTLLTELRRKGGSDQGKWLII